jgi:hypothetical protein
MSIVGSLIKGACTVLPSGNLLPPLSTCQNEAISFGDSPVHIDVKSCSATYLFMPNL